jgi:hypothetical protein
MLVGALVVGAWTSGLPPKPEVLVAPPGDSDEPVGSDEAESDESDESDEAESDEAEPGEPGEPGKSNEPDDHERELPVDDLPTDRGGDDAGTPAPPAASTRGQIRIDGIPLTLRATIDGAWYSPSFDGVVLAELPAGPHEVAVRKETRKVSLVAGRQARLTWSKRSLLLSSDTDAQPLWSGLQRANGPTRISAQDYRMLVSSLEVTPWNEVEQRLGEVVAAGYTFSAAEVGSLVAKIGYPHRVDAIEVVAHSVVDPENVGQILSHLGETGGERGEVMALFEPLASATP